jgi:hypothetical protein
MVKSENAPIETLLRFHWLVCSIGLIGIIYGLSWKLHAALLAGRRTTTFYDWALPFFFPNKPQRIIFFIGAGAGLFIYYALAFFFTKKQRENRASNFAMADLWSLRFIFFYIILPLGVNAAVAAGFPSAARPRIPVSAYLLTVLWLSTALLPFYPPLDQMKARYRLLMDRFLQLAERVNRRLEKRVYTLAVAGLTIFSFTQVVSMFLPFMQGELLMMNEFMDMPEQTLMGTQYAPNTEFINAHDLGGLLKYEPTKDHGASPIPRNGTFFEMPRTALLDDFIERNKTKYCYSDPLQALVIHGVMTADERAELSAIVDHSYVAGIMSLYHQSRERSERLRNRTYTAEELEFLSKNRLEMRWQILNRWVIHHHNYVLGPINEYALGKPLQDINVQYGVFNVVVMKYLLEKTGGISYQNYFQKWYVFWPLYYALFVAVAFLVFGDVYYVAFVCVLAFGFINKIDYQHLFLAPGLNPIRHFFDVPVIACLYLYFKNGKWLPLSAGIVLGLISVLNNQQFGLFLIGAVVVILIAKFFLDKGAQSKSDIAWATMTMVAAGVIVLSANVGKNEMAAYFFEGFLGNMIDPVKLFLMMLAISACYVIILRMESAKPEARYTVLFLLVYAQGALIYYIWGGDEKHLFNIASILVFGAGLILKLVIDHTSINHFHKAVVAGLTILIFLGIYTPGVVAYYKSRHEYKNIFADHKTYDWELETARFRSTMDPSYFADSISLIHEYEPSHNEIYLISKYDNFVPFLAKRYSAMPFFDLQWFLLSPKEVVVSIERIRQNRPQYLFVDTDIERDFNGEVLLGGLQSIGFPGEESLQRLQRLHLLKDIFRAVKDDYTPVKKGVLLTVYKRTA